MAQWITYMLQCADGTFYIGSTTDLERRLAEHNGLAKGTGKGAKYTKTRRPVQVAHVEYWASRSEAQKREAELKKLSHTEKESLRSTQ